jgi:hypothetical protein
VRPDELTAHLVPPEPYRMDCSNDLSYIPRSLAIHGNIDDALLDRVSRLEHQDPVQTVSGILLLAAELVPAGLRVPAIEHFVRDGLTPQDEADIAQRRRDHAGSQIWRATAAEMLRVLATRVRAGAPAQSFAPSLREACHFAQSVLRQHHILVLLNAAEHDPDSVHSALPQADRDRVRDLMLGMTSQPRALDDTIVRWDDFVADLAAWGYDEFANGLFVRDQLVVAEVACCPDSGQMLRERYAAIDQRYLKQTRTIGHAIHDGPGRWSPRGWWWYRAPLGMDADFARSAGIALARPPDEGDPGDGHEPR